MSSAKEGVQLYATVSVLPKRLLRIMSGETGLSFLSALMSSSSLSWRLRGRGGCGFSLRAETWHDKQHKWALNCCHHHGDQSEKFPLLRTVLFLFTCCWWVCACDMFPIIHTQLFGMCCECHCTRMTTKMCFSTARLNMGNLSYQ